MIPAVQATSANAPYPDVDGVWCEEYVRNLSDKNIISGYEDGTYRPKNPVSRGAIAKMVLLSMQEQGSLVVETTKNNPLTDTKGTWPEKYIVPLCELNVIEAEEYENGFAQQGAMSRLETIKTLVRAYLHAHPDMELPENLASDFTDKNSISNKDMAYVKLGVELGIINGYPTEDGGVEFRPAESIERGTAAAMIGRFMDKVGTISDHAGTSDVRQDTQLPEVKANDLPVIKTTDGKTVEWVLAPTLENRTSKGKRFFSDFADNGLCSYYTDTSYTTRIFVDKEGYVYDFRKGNIQTVGDFIHGLAPAKDMTTGKYGFINFKGEWIIPATYYDATEFRICKLYSGETAYYALVTTSTHYDIAYITPENRTIDVATYDKTVKSSSHYKAVSAKEVQKKVSSKYDVSDSYADGVFPYLQEVSDTSNVFPNVYGLMDENGHILVRADSKHGFDDYYSQAHGFGDYTILTGHAGFSTAWYNSIYDNKGKLVGTCYEGTEHDEYQPYRCIYDYGEGLFSAIAHDDQDSKFGYMKPNTDFFIEPVFDNAEPFNNGVAWVEYNGLWGLIKNPLN